MTKRNDIRNKLIGLMRPMSPMRLISLIGLIGLMGLTVHAQEIVVGGNIYGGGNAGNVAGNTTVTVREGDLNQVFGGARMANVGGRSFVNIDGEHAIDFMVINKVYGGNDIAGTIGTSTVPSELTEVIPEPTAAELAATEPAKTRDEWRADYKTEHPEKNDVDGTWNSYVRISSKMDPDVCYTQAECDEHNAQLTGAISNTTDLTAEQATALNGISGVSTTYAAGANPSADDAKLYNAQLAGAWTTNDIKTHTKVAADNEKVYIGQLFAGGNGDYTRRSPGEDNKNTYRIYDKSVTDYVNANPIAERTMDFAPPALDKTYLEIKGGSIVYAYGGGNNATVRENTIIYYNNPSDVVNEIWVKNGDEVAAGTQGATNLLSNDRFKNKMGINTGFSYPSSADFQVGRLFGGNNRAEMAIMPTWNLQRGLIRNLYSGGNQGAMTNSIGLLLEIDPLPDYEGKTEHLVIDNVYGGCRMADVRPLLSGTISSGTFIESQSGDITLKERFKEEDGTPKYYFPDGLAARVLIKGGHINNVYGGNDITGRVYGGNAIGINTTIYGDIYGGGNGSYPYTDNASMQGNDIYGDLYYGDPEHPYNNGFQSIEALNNFRPNAEQVSIHLTGKYERDATGKVIESTIVPTIIHGSVYCGGNSATLKSTKAEPIVELKFGSYVIADKVFLGNNGENMVATTPEVKDNDIITRHGGVLWSYKNKTNFTKIDLDEDEPDATGKTQMDLYMEGVSMHMTPSVVFDQKGTGNTIKDRDDYVEYSSYVGSFFCGGNIGSIDIAGKIPINFNHNLIIYDKVVGGCNNSNVPTLYAADDPDKERPLNVPYEGGILGTTATTNDPNNKVKIELNFEGLKMQPKRWDATYTEYTGDKLVIGNTYYTTDLGDGEFVAESETKKEGKYYEMTDPGTKLVWNTIKKISHVDDIPQRIQYNPDKPNEWDIINSRLIGGNIYGGCYNSGHVEGDVVINLNSALVDLSGDYAVFDEFTEKTTDGKPWKLYDYDTPADYDLDNIDDTKRHSHVLLPEQGMEVFGLALNVYGGGKGKDTEIWGSSYINLLKGYTFQIFGGSQEGVIGKGTPVEDDYTAQAGEYVTNGKKYTYNADYSTYINMSGEIAGVSTTESNAVLSSDDAEEKAQMKNLAEALFIYGGGYEGLVAGDTHINLGNGRVFNTFAGSCNADLLGHTETYIGRQWDNQEKTYTDGGGFPWVTDHIYGGNDLGGEIKGYANTSGSVIADMIGRVRDGIKDKLYSNDVTKAAAYVEYLQGRVENIFGGAYGDYDYDNDPAYDIATDDQPRLDNAFINFKPLEHANNYVEKLFGAGQGQSLQSDKDKMQNRSYLLIDIPQTVTKFQNLEVFGAGAWSGLGMNTPAADTFAEGFDLNKVTGVIDLMRGQIGAAYGGSYEEGVTRRTMVNVPEGSTIQIGSIFGGAYGVNAYYPCDVYEANVNWLTKSEEAYLISNNTELTKGFIYGGNNNARRTLYGKINISAPVRQKHYKYGMTTATVYGAGCGPLTWNEYTEVNLNDGANVYEVYGGAEAGSVMSAESVQAYISAFKPEKWPKDKDTDPDVEFTEDDWLKAWSLGKGYDPVMANKTPLEALKNGYVTNTYTNLNNPLVRVAEMDDREIQTYKYNTNVIIHKGAYVGNYAYGGGLGKSGQSFVGSGDVYGTTYIALLGGTVSKDLYAAGTIGAVLNQFNADFTASATAYVEGGTCRNVYGGGWEGSVGHHAGALSASPIDDVLGETHVVIGVRRDQSDANLLATLRRTLGENATINDYGFLCGVPAIQRNAYGGGEGGAVFGTTHLTLNNGYIGYVRFDEIPTTHTDLPYIKYGNDYYQEKIHDETFSDENHPEGSDNFRLEDCGNVYGGGYDDNSNVDESIVTIYGGVIRNSLYGGGEIATIGRGSTKEEGAKRTLQAIYKAGKTQVELFNGKVLHDVFGGGKGFNLLGYGHSSDKERLYTDGYVFGQTEVHIHGGEVGTKDGVAAGLGNVFGGGNVGFVYSPGFFNANTKHDATNNTGSPDHYYYYEQQYKCTAAPADGKYADKYQEGDLIDEITYNALVASNQPTGTWQKQSKKLAETCKVVVSPYLQVKAGVEDFTFEGKTYGPYDYVPTDYLNTLPKKDNTNGWTGNWQNLVVEDVDGTERGILIHNAVFAGGNVSSNNDQTYANATTVYGNTTATLYDAYHRDFITVGTEHTGGLYGGGNLSMVDGYRELNITNYGTDYYSLEQTITIDQYRDLSNRERAYFKLKYELKATTTFTKEGLEPKTYSIEQADQKLIEEEEYLKLVEQYGDQVVNAFTPYGECSIYAGRLLNTIQRADFCGVYGSRLVLQGAKDRVTDVAVTDVYTINRVGELSLNKKKSVISADTGDDAEHGNYFGIYSVVNYLGNLTSDVRFGDNFRNGNGEEVEAYFNSEGEVVENPTEQEINDLQLTKKKYTYYTYKSTKPTSNKRNHGKSVNQVALASGVFLELTTEHSTEEKKDYGYITGVIELDLINVKKDNVGGGFVYAKNEHRVPKYYPNKENVLLSEYNKEKIVEGVERRDEARTYKRYRYATPEQETLDETEHDPRWDDSKWTEDEGAFVISGDDSHVYKTMSYQTSGNFIHHSKTIVDDCYPTNNAYIIKNENFSPAHYWYVKGTVYIYDQTVSAYTGSANAYSKEVRLPLTITAASHGQLQLLNVKPNLYAYKMPGTNGINVKIGSENDTNGKPIDKVWVNNDADNYQLNDVITWWDWHQLSPTERAYFVTETFVNCVACKIDGTEYAAGEYVMDNTDYNTFKTGTHTVTDLKGEAFANDFEVFRSSNNISHDTGYVLTFDMSSPSIWDDYYTKVNDNTQKISKAQYEDMLANAADDAAKQDIYNTWIEGPSFTPKETGVYGKREFKEGAIITQNTFDSNSESTAEFEPAYIAKETVTYTHTYQVPSETEPTTMETKTVQKTVNPGTAIPYSEYNTEVSDPDKAAFISSTDLYVCTTPYSYTVGEGNEAQTINVAEGTVINQADYNQLTSEQKGKYAQGAYVCFNKVVIGETTYKPGSVIALSNTEYNALTDAQKASITNNCTMVCNKTVELEKGVYLVYGELKTLDEVSAMKVKYPALKDKIDEAMTPAYICSVGGEYGGQQYYKGHNYSAIQGWSSLSTTDRIANDGSYKFDYNYDALDLLTDKAYLVVNGIETPDHDITVDAFHSPYTDPVGVEYQAVFKKAGVDVEVDGRSLNDGEGISKDQFESLQNDQLHYTRVDVTSNHPTVYFATSNFTYKGVPYGKGQEIDEDIYLANADEAKSKVEAVTFNNVISGNPYYYCYESYNNGSVSKGSVLTQAEFNNLTNLQKYFIIQGQEPTERTTLYVSRESDYYDVLKEKVVTVVYQYTYYEEEDNGNIKQTNELHVVNVHLQLESGSPSIGLLNPPATVLPGWTVGMRAPDVSPGLYEVLENGWELYTTKDDADNHRNGIPFDSKTPVYWYQNGDNYIAFYSKTYLGKTYSPNYVPLSVANYHDLDEVMQDKEHHMYVDRSDVDRESKIYINNVTCKSDPDKSELDLLRDFFDLSLLKSNSTGVAANVVTAGELKDHTILNSYVEGGKHLEFFLNGDISPKKYNKHLETTNPGTPQEETVLVGPGWTSIGDDSHCFEADFHGNGYTISGLTSSLFGKLCRNVYNLGVTGSFTGAGIAETGGGYVENCWVKTSATTPQSSKVKAVYGNPERAQGDNSYDGPIQVVNCYYSADNEGIFSNATDDLHGTAKMMPEKAFYDGTVAYNLNGFYLKDRYDRNNGTATDINDPYVKNRYADGDFRYAGGSIPESVDKRMTTKTETDSENNETTVTEFIPIWPSDYLFFGQTLNYGYGGTHQDNPGHISGSNRVYRAPAYYGNSTMSVVHFNPDAVLAAKSNDGTRDAYPGMTAVDFKGHYYTPNEALGAYSKEWESGQFYAPLLDDDGLTSIANHGETQNLVVYAPSAEQNAKTLGVLTNYFKDPALSDYDETSNKYTDGKKYGRVAIAHAGSVLGHLVQSDLTATNDHFLVDKQDFNAPISYQFDTDHLMWYQRIPSNYVSIDWSEDATPVRSTKGWVGISLPFKADLVTTQTKGEITHFYEGNTTGHEYWLREFTGIDSYDATEHELKATMEYLKKESGNTKEYTNNFLWDYYYSENTHIDKNTDEYQTYYNKSHTYLGYPSLAATKPYIIGFPGQQYYEFDLSGNWAPKNTSDDSKWNATTETAQTISFVSKKGITVGKSDQDMEGGQVKHKDVTFMPNYMNTTFAANTAATYTPSIEGSSYDLVPATPVTVPAFRPYFTGTYNANSNPAPRRIVFSGGSKTSLEPDVTEHNDGDGGLHISTDKKTIVVRSTLRDNATVRITTAAGIDVATFTIEPGQTVKTPVPMTGVYMVNQKKILVK